MARIKGAPTKLEQAKKPKVKSTSMVREQSLAARKLNSKNRKGK